MEEFILFNDEAIEDGNEEVEEGIVTLDDESFTDNEELLEISIDESIELEVGDKAYTFISYLYMVCVSELVTMTVGVLRVYVAKAVE